MNAFETTYGRMAELRCFCGMGQGAQDGSRLGNFAGGGIKVGMGAYTGVECLCLEEERPMCQSMEVREEDKRQPPEERDVDDLIFRDEREWLTSDR